MPVPKKHKTKSRRNTRRSHMALKAANLSACTHCGSPVFSHTVCSHCGYYKGKEIIDTLAKTEKKAARKRGKKEEAKKEKESGKSPESLEELSKKQ